MEWSYKMQKFQLNEKKSTWRKIGNIGWSAFGRQNPGMWIGPPCRTIILNMCKLTIRNLNNIWKSQIGISLIVTASPSSSFVPPCRAIIQNMCKLAIRNQKQYLKVPDRNKFNGNSLTFFFLRSLSRDVDTASRTSFIYEGSTSLGTEIMTLDKASHAT